MAGKDHGSIHLNHYQAEIGDTERSVEEIISEIKGYGEPIAGVALNRKGVGRTASGSVIAITVTENSLDEQELKRILNESGGCMYQVVSVNKDTQ